MSNGLDPDQDRQNVGADRGPNCLQRLSVDDKSYPKRGELTYLSAPSTGGNTGGGGTLKVLWRCWANKPETQRESAF